MKQLFQGSAVTVYILLFAASAFSQAPKGQDAKAPDEIVLPEPGIAPPPTDTAGAETEADSAAPGAPLTAVEVMEGMQNAEFGAAMQTCVSGRAHPKKVWLNMKINPDGSVQLISVDPDPLEEVYLCIVGAASKLKFRETNLSKVVEYPYVLPHPHEEPLPGWGSPVGPVYGQPVGSQMEGAAKGKPGNRNWGMGLYGALIPLDRAKLSIEYTDEPSRNMEVEHFDRFTGGVGLFIEFVLMRYFALGMELALSFPRVDEVKADGGATQECLGCEQDVAMRFLLRLKFLISMAKRVSLYPVVLFGYSDYIFRAEDRDAWHFHGCSFGLGMGVEGYAGKTVTPFFELRYLLHAGWHKEDPHEAIMNLLHHNLALMIGLRFP